MSTTRKMFLNLAVSDLERSMAFFSALGFTFNRQFCDENAACMIINDAAMVMLLTEPMFQRFTTRSICDTRTHAEGLFALSCERREAVDELITRALAAGATELGAPQDHGFMYYRSFSDLDGHHWEFLWMDPAHADGCAA